MQLALFRGSSRHRLGGPPPHADGSDGSQAWQYGPDTQSLPHTLLAQNCPNLHPALEVQPPTWHWPLMQPSGAKTVTPCALTWVCGQSPEERHPGTQTLRVVSQMFPSGH